MNSDKSQEEVKAITFQEYWDKNTVTPDEGQSIEVQEEYSNAYKSASRLWHARDAEVLALLEGLKKAKEALEKHHAHDQESLVVYFEQDGKPIEMFTDLGEAYSESGMCEETVKALKSISHLLQPSGGAKEK